MLITNIGCENFQGIARNDTLERINIAQLRCKQWSCHYCARKNALQWRAAIIDYINKNPSEWSFWTITCPSWIRRGSKMSRYWNSLKLIQLNWDSFMKRAKRMLGKFQYIRVLESHKDGTIHVHLLASIHLPDVIRVERKDGSIYYYNKILKKHATDCKFGWICDHRNLIDVDGDISENWHAGKVAAYCTKYITKDLAKNDQERKDMRVRKIQTSQGIKRVNVSSEDTWSLASGIYLDDYFGNNLPVYDVTLMKFVNHEDFRGGMVYPPIPGNVI